MLHTIFDRKTGSRLHQKTIVIRMTQLTLKRGAKKAAIHKTHVTKITNAFTSCVTKRKNMGIFNRNSSPRE